LRARQGVRTKAKLGDVVAYALDLLGRRLRFHHHQHADVLEIPV